MTYVVELSDPNTGKVYELGERNCQDISLARFYFSDMHEKQLRQLDGLSARSSFQNLEFLIKDAESSIPNNNSKERTGAILQLKKYEEMRSWAKTHPDGKWAVEQNK